MARVMHKFVLDRVGEHFVEMQKHVPIQHVMHQGVAIVIYATVDPDAPKVKRRFEVVATGQTMDDHRLCYVGTAAVPNGLVFHVYEDVILNVNAK